jgi:hypothetical protein
MVMSVACAAVESPTASAVQMRIFFIRGALSFLKIFELPGVPKTRLGRLIALAAVAATPCTCVKYTL